MDLPEISIHALREPRPPRGGRHVLGQSTAHIKTFLSTPSARRATFPAARSSRPPANFYPRPPRGGRRQSSKSFAVRRRFLSTPSARRATPSAFSSLYSNSISIHALREEGDQHLRGRCPGWSQHFYPRPPRGGRLMFHLAFHLILGISIHALREEGDF